MNYIAEAALLETLTKLAETSSIPCSHSGCMLKSLAIVSCNLAYCYIDVNPSQHKMLPCMMLSCKRI